MHLSAFSMRGSSPHTRGTRDAGFHQRGGDRFIPAYAGNTLDAEIAESARGVHPRIRGEHSTSRRRASPKSPGRTAVHPRIRGEHELDDRIAKLAAGSSPHTRGTRQFRRHARYQRRFIPAYAGNTGCMRPARRPEPVHPRIRGEHRGARSSRRMSGGSSPHTRGTPEHKPNPLRRVRFIPAYAGNTDAGDMQPGSGTVHPRIRGEHDLLSVDRRGRDGSSPHTRGTHRVMIAMIRFLRFIPAYAGNTPAATRLALAIAVHPRIRGEHPPSSANIAATCGSSPHTRGTPPRRRAVVKAGRFIPAYAGNTS